MLPAILTDTVLPTAPPPRPSLKGADFQKILMQLRETWGQPTAPIPDVAGAPDHAQAPDDSPQSDATAADDPPPAGAIAAVPLPAAGTPPQPSGDAVPDLADPIAPDPRPSTRGSDGVIAGSMPVQVPPRAMVDPSQMALPGDGAATSEPGAVAAGPALAIPRAAPGVRAETDDGPGRAAAVFASLRRGAPADPAPPASTHPVGERRGTTATDLPRIPASVPIGIATPRIDALPVAPDSPEFPAPLAGPPDRGEPAATGRSVPTRLPSGAEYRVTLLPAMAPQPRAAPRAAPLPASGPVSGAADPTGPVPPPAAPRPDTPPDTGIVADRRPEMPPATPIAAPHKIRQTEQSAPARDTGTTGDGIPANDLPPLRGDPLTAPAPHNPTPSLSLTAPANQAEILRHVAGQIGAAMPERDGPGFELRLDPEELGPVRLKLVSHDQGSLLVIHADRPETLDLMRRHIAALESDLRALGHSQISLRFDGGQAGQGHTSQGQAQQGHAAPEQRDTMPGGVTTDPPRPATHRPERVATDRLDLRL